MACRLAWFKVYDGWWKSPSHDTLSGVAKAVGLRLLSVASSSRERGVVLDGKGAPKDLKLIAREAGFPAVKTAKAVEELVAVGTVTRRESDGALVFPRFEYWQTSPVARRKQAQRERDKSRQESRPEDVTCPSKSHDRGQRTEDRGQSIKIAQTSSVLAEEGSKANPPPPPRPEPVTGFSFRLKSGQKWSLTEVAYERLRSDWPSVDVAIELRQAVRWCAENPPRRKTAKGMPSFLRSWMHRAHQATVIAPQKRRLSQAEELAEYAREAEERTQTTWAQAELLLGPEAGASSDGVLWGENDE